MNQGCEQTPIEKRYWTLLRIYKEQRNAIVIGLRRPTWISRAVTRTLRTHNHHALEPRMKTFMKEDTLVHNNVQWCLHKWILISVVFCTIFEQWLCRVVCNTGWPRKNATPTITNFKEIKEYIKIVRALMRRKFFFKQNDTKINDFDECVFYSRAIFLRQCHFFFICFFCNKSSLLEVRRNFFE